MSGFPLVAAGARAVDLQLAFKRKVLGVALDGNDVDRFGLVGVDVDDEAEVGGKVAADLGPVVAGVVGAHDVPVFLHEENAGAFGIHGDVVDAVAGFGGGVGNVFGVETLVDGLPGFAAVVGAEGSRGGDRDVDAVGIRGIEDDGVEAHAARAGLPLRTGAVTAQAGEFVPADAAIGGAEEGGIFNAGVDGVGVGERGLEVPDALELPRMLRAVVPLMGGEGLAGFFRGVVREAIALHGRPLRRGVFGLDPGLIPGLAAIVGGLEDLAEPAAGLRDVDAVGIYGRAFHVVDLPAREVRAGDFPVVTFAVRRENECAFARSDQDTHLIRVRAHLGKGSWRKEIVLRGDCSEFGCRLQVNCDERERCVRFGKREAAGSRLNRRKIQRAATLALSTIWRACAISGSVESAADQALRNVSVGVARASRIAGEFAHAGETVEREARVGPLFERIFIGGFGAGVVFHADEGERFVFADGANVHRRLVIAEILLRGKGGGELLLSCFELCPAR